MLKRLLTVIFAISCINISINCMEKKSKKSCSLKQQSFLYFNKLLHFFKNCLRDRFYSKTICDAKIDLLQETRLLPELKNIIKEYCKEWELYKEIDIAHLPDDNVNFLAFTSNNKYLAYTQAEGRGMERTTAVAITDLDHEKIIKAFALSGHYAEILFTNNDQNLIVSESFSKYIKNIDINNAKIINQTESQSRLGFKSISTSNNSKYLAAIDKGAMKIYDKENLNFLTERKDKDSYCQVLFSPNGKFLSFGSHSGIKILDIANNKILNLEDSFIRELFSFSFDDKLFATTSPQTVIQIWDMQTHTVQKFDTRKSDTQKQNFESNVIMSLAFSPKEMLLASGHEDGAVKIWDPISISLIQTINFNYNDDDQAVSLKFSPDGKYLAYILRMSGKIIILKQRNL